MKVYVKQSKKNSISVAVSLVLLSLLVLVMFSQIPKVTDISDYLILLSLMVIVLTSLIVNSALNGFDVFEPINIIALTYIQIFVVAPWVWLVQGRTSWFGYPAIHNLQKASLLFLVGYLAFFWGYCIHSKYKLNKTVNVHFLDETCRRLVVKMAIFVMTVALAGSVFNSYISGKNLLFTLTLGRVTGEGSIDFQADISAKLLFVTMFINLLIPAFMLLYAFQKKNRWLLGPVFVLILLFNLASGFRYRVLLLVFAPLLYNFLKNNKRPKLLSIAVFIVIAFAIVTVIGAWRTGIRTGSEFTTLNSSVLLDAYMPNVEIFFPFYRILDVIPQSYPYTLGRGYLYVFTITVPRTLWPEKPYPPMQDILTLAFGRQGMLSGPAYPNIGEFYIEFGLIGILVGMLIFGYFARWTASLYKNTDRSVFSKIGYSILFPYFLQIVCRGYFPQIFLESLFTFGPIIAVEYIIRRSSNAKKCQLSGISGRGEKNDRT
jgi:oligosaccharide repeat unit polymerase